MIRTALDRQNAAFDRQARIRSLELCVAVLCGLGLTLVYSASCVSSEQELGDGAFFLKRQLMWVAIAVVALMAVSRVPVRTLHRLAYPGLVVGLLALLVVLVPGIGEVRGGARRWIGLGPLSLQPAEPFKLALVLFLARYLSGGTGDRTLRLRPVLAGLAVTGAGMALVAVEPDMSTALVLGATALTTLFVAGTRIAHLSVVFAAAAPVAVWAIVAAPYRVRRLLAFLDPWAHADGVGYQIVQSFLAFGSGGTFGRGLGMGHQKLFYLPESHTDFVFAVLGEELGFFGVVVVSGLFFLLLLQGARVALGAQDEFERILAGGLTALLGIEITGNMTVCLGLVPTTGLALPFLSYGGSSMLTSAVAVGMIGAVDRDRRPSVLKGRVGR